MGKQDDEFMRRKRFQKGSVRPRKHGRRKVWVAQWWEQRGKRSKVLGHYAEITKGQAHAMLAQILQPVNEGVGTRHAPVFTFQQYVQDVFLPAYRQKWKESTRSTSEPDILRYLIPAFGSQLVNAKELDELEALGQRELAIKVDGQPFVAGGDGYFKVLRMNMDPAAYARATTKASTSFKVWR